MGRSRVRSDTYLARGCEVRFRSEGAARRDFRCQEGMYISASDTFSFAFFPFFFPPRVGRWSQGSSRWWGSRENGWVDGCMDVYVDGVGFGV